METDMNYGSVVRQSGFTLIELIAAVAIVAIGLTIASNSFSSAVSASRTSNAVSSLYASLTLARSRAATAGVDVVLCPSGDGTSCAAGDHWENGWIAFAATHAGSDRMPDEPILLHQDALPNKVHLATSRGRTRIRFQPSGGNAGSNATFTFCDSRGPAKASAYAMANTGNLHATTPDAANVTDACAGL
jgi:type IV fimbrial biogenesis protein FimT